MSNTNITKEVDELVSLAFRFVNHKGKSTIEETIDCIRQAKSCIEDEDEVINELARTNFGNFNRVRDFFVKNYSRFKKYKITKEWMYDFINGIKNVDGILDRGVFKKYTDISDELSQVFVERIHDIQPERTVGGGEYLIAIIFSLIDEVTKPDAKTGISGDMMFQGEVYEVKGNQGRMDGADDNRLLDVLAKYPEMNNGKSSNIWASQHENLVKDMLRCYFEGNNPYPIIAINKNVGGYVIIDEQLKWEGADIGLVIPKWMKEQAFGERRVLDFNHNKFNHNDRTIKIKMKQITPPKVKKQRKSRKK